MCNTKFLQKVIFFITGTILVFFLSGCAAISGYKSTMDEFDYNVETNNCNLNDLEEKIQDGNDALLWSQQGGSLARNCKDYKKSNALFDYAETIYKNKVDKDGISNDTLENTSNIFVNNNINDYEGNTYEKIMLNTYKALNFASLGDFSNARVEFNRAMERQNRAKEYFKQEILEQKKRLQKADDNFQKKQSRTNIANNSLQNLSQIAQNKQTQEVIYEEFDTTLNKSEIYPDFVNPFTTYISGIYFLLNNDPLKARDLLKESLAMDPTNKQIISDFELSNELVKNRSYKNDNKNIWIIYENGKSAKTIEKNISIPLFLFTRKAFYTGITIPSIKEQQSSHLFLKINGQNTTEIANMDAIIKAEFTKRFPSKMTKIVTGAILKTYTQYTLQKNLGPLGGIVGAFYQALTNKADVRSWSALPKNFQSLRIKNNGNTIVIRNNHNEIIRSVNIPENKNAIIYVRSEIPSNNRIHKIIF